MARVLLVDEDALLRSSLRRLLALEGYEVTEAEGGVEGVDLALADPPDLVLCDLRMPDLDGLEVLRRLRADPRTAGIPFVAITGGATPCTLDFGRAGGTDGYVQKPFLIDELLATVSRLLERGRSA